jgi:predicted dienelactone hydrolase
MSQLRHKGVAAAVICSEPFVRLAKARAAIAGVPDLPLIVIPHPLGGATQDEVKARAEVAMSQLIILVRELTQ